jgi:RNA polymerase sigma factor (sigma-70 family)
MPGASAHIAADERQARLLEEWSRRYRPALLRFFQRRMPAAGDPEDLVQEVFLRLARQDLTAIANVEGYLFQAAANVLKDWRRRGVRHAADAHEPASEELPAEVDFSPERVLLGKDAVSALIAALEMLPERTRAVFLLYHFDQLPQAEIARRLGIAVRTVENNMAKAHAHITALMLERTP